VRYSFDCGFDKGSMPGNVDQAADIIFGFESIVVHSESDASVSLNARFVDDPGILEGCFSPFM
jgi:hypothetical protein